MGVPEVAELRRVLLTITTCCWIARIRTSYIDAHFDKHFDKRGGGRAAAEAGAGAEAEAAAAVAAGGRSCSCGGGGIGGGIGGATTRRAPAHSMRWLPHHPLRRPAPRCRRGRDGHARRVHCLDRRRNDLLLLLLLLLLLVLPPLLLAPRTLQLGALLCVRGDFAGAARWFTAALKVDPSTP